MARHAIVNQDGKVVNVVIWEGKEWLPPRNHYVIQSDFADIGDLYDKEKNAFTKPDLQPGSYDKATNTFLKAPL